MPRRVPTGNPPGRPPKKVGPATVADIKAGVKNEDVRNMRAGNSRPQPEVLLLPSGPDASGDEEVRVFDAIGLSDSGRESGPSQVAPAGDTEQRISILVKRILREVAGREHQDGGSRRTNAEALTRLLMNRALEGNQFAIEAVLDRAEGKPVKGVTISTPDLSVEDMISQQEVALLNDLATKKEK